MPLGFLASQPALSYDTILQPVLIQDIPAVSYSTVMSKILFTKSSMIDVHRLDVHCRAEIFF